jgi:hypothetical protein
MKNQIDFRNREAARLALRKRMNDEFGVETTGKGASPSRCLD